MRKYVLWEQKCKDEKTVTCWLQRGEISHFIYFFRITHLIPARCAVKLIWILIGLLKLFLEREMRILNHVISWIRTVYTPLLELLISAFVCVELNNKSNKTCLNYLLKTFQSTSVFQKTYFLLFVVHVSISSWSWYALSISAVPVTSSVRSVLAWNTASTIPARQDEADVLGPWQRWFWSPLFSSVL